MRSVIEYTYEEVAPKTEQTSVFALAPRGMPLICFYAGTRRVLEQSLQGDGTIQCELIDADDSRWQATLSRMPHDIYHLPEYGEIAAKHDGGILRALYSKGTTGELLIPLVLRFVPHDLDPSGYLLDGASPYGYASPLISAPTRTAAVELVNRALELAARHSIVSLFLRFHPLLPIPYTAFQTGGEIRFEGPTITIDLSAGESETWRQTRGNHRSDINKLRKRGYSIVIDDWRHLTAFAAMYHDTMRRIDATDYYHFDPEYFEGLNEALPSRIHLFVAMDPDGDIAAGSLFTETDGIVQFHLGGTSPEHHAMSPSKLIVDAARRWAILRGDRVLHLGGGLGGSSDSLFAYKSGFSRSWAAYRTARIVVMPTEYSNLSGRVDSVRDRTDDDFFPRYRTAGGSAQLSSPPVM